MMYEKKVFHVTAAVERLRFFSRYWGNHQENELSVVNPHFPHATHLWSKEFKYEFLIIRLFHTRLMS